jgi:hypothetical protein
MWGTMEDGRCKSWDGACAREACDERRAAGDAMDLALIARAARRPENDGLTLGFAFALVVGLRSST